LLLVGPPVRIGLNGAAQSNREVSHGALAVPSPFTSWRASDIQNRKPPTGLHHCGGLLSCGAQFAPSGLSSFGRRYGFPGRTSRFSVPHIERPGFAERGPLTLPVGDRLSRSLSFGSESQFHRIAGRMLSLLWHCGPATSTWTTGCSTPRRGAVLDALCPESRIGTCRIKSPCRRI
jgi:hypothetical protein